MNKKVFKPPTNIEVRNLCHYLAPIILESLKAFRAAKIISHPIDLNTVEEWEEILDEMIFAFEWLIDDDIPEADGGLLHKEWIKKWERADKGIELFSKYYRDLWI